MNTTFSIGIDMGGTNTDIGLVMSNGTIQDKANLSTAQYDDPVKYIDDLADGIKKLMKRNAVETISGIGIGAPNANYYTGCIEDATNLHFKGNFPLKVMIQERIPVPVQVSNDANAAAYGELIFGGAKTMRNFIMFTLGTGVGSGIVIDRKLVHGSDGCAGELGHSILIPNGRLCGCKRRGCLEQYTSAGGITQNCIELMKQAHYDSPLTRLEPEKLSCKTIGDAANAGDPLAIKVFEYTGNLLGLALANSVTFSSPEAIFLMGGPIKVGDVFLNPIKESFKRNLLFVYKDNVQILVSSLKENEVAILGAAALVES